LSKYFQFFAAVEASLVILIVAGIRINGIIAFRALYTSNAPCSKQANPGSHSLCQSPQSFPVLPLALTSIKIMIS